MTNREQRTSVKHQLREMRDLINRWDPVGLLAAGAPADEYECLVGPILSHLGRGATALELTRWLDSHITAHFGRVPADSAHFTEKACAWYEQYRKIPPT
jgi:hypothetical protein